jgi:hypothetical protein
MDVITKIQLSPSLILTRMQRSVIREQRSHENPGFRFASSRLLALFCFAEISLKPTSLIIMRSTIAQYGQYPVLVFVKLYLTADFFSAEPSAIWQSSREHIGVTAHFIPASLMAFCMLAICSSSELIWSSIWLMA